MSFDNAIFSGSQKFWVRRFHTSRSTGSSILFQLIGLVIISFPLKHAAYAVLDISSFESGLANTNVVNSLDALAPCVDLGTVDITGGSGVLEEQGE